MKKIHVACGEVYLRDYINIDIQGKVRSETPFCPVIETTFDKYYVKPLDFTPKETRGNFIIDQRVNILLPWPWADNSIDEVLMIQAIEHFNPFEGEFIIKEVYRVLKPDGKFVFDFPDLIQTFNQYKDYFDKLIRLVFCHHKDLYASHKVAYNEETFTRLLNSENRKWKSIEFKEVVEHAYPVIGGIAVK